MAMMSTTIRTVILIAISSVTLSCGQHADGEHQHENVAEETPQRRENPALSLDKGNLWVANPETNEGIIKMQILMSSFSNRESPEAFASLKADLVHEYQMIFDKCTMTGEAHDQLHSYLLPMKDMLEGLASSNLKIRKRSFESLNDHLKEYSNYFE